jgi:hypothetical protein
MDDEKTGRNTKTENAPSSMDTAESIHMNLGLAFVKATKPTPQRFGEPLRRELEFVDGRRITKLDSPKRLQLLIK